MNNLDPVTRLNAALQGSYAVQRELGEARRAKIRLYSRIGLWSVVVGMAPVAIEIISSTWTWTINPGSVVPDLGLIVGGAGIAMSSGLALKELGGELRPVKLAALAGVPLGLTLVMLGSMLFSEYWFPPNQFLQSLFALGLRGAVVLGITVMVMLVVAFVGNSWEAREPDD